MPIFDKLPYSLRSQGDKLPYSLRSQGDKTRNFLRDTKPFYIRVSLLQNMKLI
jgi:hypothetical protein